MRRAALRDDSRQRQGELCSKQEWTRALKYKEPIIPIRLHRDAETPFRLEPRQHVDFSRDFDAGVKRLRENLVWRASPPGVLSELEYQLEDAKRDLARARKRGSEEEVDRAQGDVEQLTEAVEAQRKIVADPEGAKRRTERSVLSGLERERRPVEPQAHTTSRKFINPPPARAPS